MSRFSLLFQASRGLSTSTSSRSYLRSLRKNAPVDIHPEVEEALATGKPVVAFETALVTHGLPSPVNLQTSQSVEHIARSTGSIPATIGVLDGRVKIGLTPSELERLADAHGSSDMVKLSRRDIAAAVTLKRSGGTTCSATLVFAAMAGIKVFATGGLGGVHRGAENSMDISADLQELTRCPVGLVSAGVKSILDIGRTLEYLETLGIPVISYSKTKDFPAFFTPRSGFKTSWNVDNPTTAAQILLTHAQLGMNHGALFGLPIPEQYEPVGASIQDSVDQAVKEAEENGVSMQGKDVTPWILARVADLTHGKSISSNVALLENTALVGGHIAVEYTKLLQESAIIQNGGNQLHVVNKVSPEDVPTKHSVHDSLPVAKLIIIGSAAVDVTAQADTTPSISANKYTTFPGRVSFSLGGVARNIAESCHRILTKHSAEFSSSTLLLSSVGQDTFGRFLTDQTRELGMRIDGLISSKGAASAVCNMVLDSAGDLIGGVADMSIIRSLSPDIALGHITKHRPAIVAVDGNLSHDTLKKLVVNCNKRRIEIFFEPTSVLKSESILPAVAASLAHSQTMRSPITYASPNILELTRMYRKAQSEPLNLTSHPNWWQVVDNFALTSSFRVDLEQLARRKVSDEDDLKGTLSFLVDEGIAQMAVNLLPFFQHLLIKCGSRGVFVVMRISGRKAAEAVWSQERSNIHSRCIVAHAKSSQEVVVLKHFPPLALAQNLSSNVTGAGDTLVGSILSSLVKNPLAFDHPDTLDKTISSAQRAAILTLQSHLAVSPLLSA